MGALQVIYDGAAMAELLASPTGPMGLFLLERGEMIKRISKVNIGLMTEQHTGCLEASPVKRFSSDGPMLTVTIQSDTSPCAEDHKSYSLFVHDGTAPHVIDARPGGVLAFESHGQIMFATSVNHPGTAPRPFLRSALEQLASSV
jgi:hypothetical protein